MVTKNPNNSEKGNKQEGKKLYQSPAVIHAGTISTRAGSPVGLANDSEKNAVDPADLFGNGN